MGLYNWMLEYRWGPVKTDLAAESERNPPTDPGSEGPEEGRCGGSTDVRLLFALVPRVSIDPDLDFLANVTQIVDTRFADRFSFRFDEAVRTAR